MDETTIIPGMGVRPAECLVGMQLSGGWHVDSIITRHPKGTGGCFSVSYKVSRKDGKTAFLKALDFSAAFQGPRDQARILQDMTTAYNYERDLLHQCSGLSRIVTPISDGYADIKRLYPLNQVPYLIFEMAKNDIRSEIADWNDFDLAWALRVLHNGSVGLQQLHLKRIVHQDLKPSNVLYFHDEGSKLSDLGCASSALNPSPRDVAKIPGDFTYAAPELYYGWSHVDGFEKRYFSDLYLLGSLVFFFFMGVSASQILWLKINELHRGNFTQNQFLQDLPYWQEAFTISLLLLEQQVKLIAGKLSDAIIQIARELCEPDPRRRGNPKIFNTLVPQYDLQNYITRFNLLARKAEARLLI